MTIDSELLDILICPKCQGKLQVSYGSQNDINKSDDKCQGTLICTKCQLGFAIEADIPVLLIDEAQDLS